MFVYFTLFIDFAQDVSEFMSTQKRGILGDKVFCGAILFLLAPPTRARRTSLRYVRSGGDERARTSDLNNVNVAL